VGDDDGGDAVAFQQALDLDLHVEPQVLVERRKNGSSSSTMPGSMPAPRQRHALLLPADNWPGGRLGAKTCHLHQRQHLGDLAVTALPRSLRARKP